MQYNKLLIEEELLDSLNYEETIYYLKNYKLEDDLEARSILIKHNIRSVLSIVKNKYRNLIEEWEELISIGIVGLIKSIDTFDISKNHIFTTYSFKCIENEINNFLRKINKHKNIESLNEKVSIENDRELIDEVTDKSIDVISLYEEKELNNILHER